MTVKIFLPTEIFLEQENILALTAEGLEGYFTLLPQHIDYVSILVPGILTLLRSDNSGARTPHSSSEHSRPNIGQTR